MKPCRNAGEIKTGMATKSRLPAEYWHMYSERDISEQSNSWPPDMRSKMSRRIVVHDEI